MLNILGKNENLSLYNKEGGWVYSYFKDSSGCSFEETYDDNGNTLTHKDSNGYWRKMTYDHNGNTLTLKNSDGFWHEMTYDNEGNELTYKDSNGYSCESTYDSNGNQLTYKNSNGERIGLEIPEYTMEELVSKIGNFKIKN